MLYSNINYRCIYQSLILKTEIVKNHSGYLFTNENPTLYSCKKGKRFPTYKEPLYFQGNEVAKWLHSLYVQMSRGAQVDDHSALNRRARVRHSPDETPP